MKAVHLVVPDSIDDPQQPSGGNHYDRRASRELAAIGWSVHEHPVRGSWPMPSAVDLAALAAAVNSIPDGAVVLVDGLIASTAHGLLVPATDRLRLVVLVHMPLCPAPDEAAHRAEEAILSAAAAVVTTSAWTRHRLLERYSLDPDQVHVAEPGVDPADVAPGTDTGGELLCVAAVIPPKGHDVLLAALATIQHLPWRCTCVGSLRKDPDFVERLRRQAGTEGIDGRVRFTGPLTGVALDDAYAAADVLVLASHGETYGMVVTEALARGLPVVATAVGGLPHTLSREPGRTPPGLLVPSQDPAALAKALCSWLGDPALRRRLRHAAALRRGVLADWSTTARQIARVLAGLT